VRWLCSDFGENLMEVKEQNIYFLRSAIEPWLYYFSAAYPKIVSNGEGPEVSLNIYRFGEEKFFASLNLCVHLPADIESAEAAAQSDTSIPDDAILLPLQFIKSEMTVAAPGMFRETFSADTNNQNYCISSISLSDKDKIMKLDALLRKPESAPIIVGYKLDFRKALPPSEFQLTADWSQVYDYLQKNIGFNLVIFSVEIEDISSKLLAEKIVKIEIKARDKDESDYFERAALSLGNILLTEFMNFNVPVAKDHDSGTKPLLGFSLKKVSIRDIQDRKLSARMVENTVVRRSIYLQTTFKSLVSNTGYDGSKVIHQNEVKDVFFEKRKLTAHLLNESLLDAVKYIALHIKYGSSIEKMVFKSGQTQPQSIEMDMFIDPVSKEANRDLSYSFQVFFKNSVAGITVVKSENFVSSSDHIYLNISSCISKVEFDIKTVSQFNWDWYQSVVVTLKGEAKGGQNQFEEILLLTKNVDRITKVIDLPHPDKFEYIANFNYTSANNSPHVNTEVIRPVKQHVMAFRQIYPQKKFTIETAFDWSVLEEVKVYVSYEYKKNKKLLN